MKENKTNNLKLILSDWSTLYSFIIVKKNKEVTIDCSPARLVLGATTKQKNRQSLFLNLAAGS